MLRLTRPAALAALVALVALGPAYAHAQYPYKLIDPGTFGGPSSYLDLPAVPLTPGGTLLGAADTTTPDSAYRSCPSNLCDGYQQHAFAWRNGHLTDLGTLPGKNGSAVYELNSHGVGAGVSQNGLDPNSLIVGGVAVIFKDGQVTSLGTLPGGSESFAQDINASGQVAGNSSDGTPDPFSFFNWGTQTRGFVWQNGLMQDLGTLGGADTVEYVQNARGQIAGWSYTNYTPNPANGGFPTTDPFLWNEGQMRDLGTLGGTFGTTSWLNDHGEVVGQSNLAGDRTTHPFLWDGRRMLDLGTLGGDNGLANWVNASGDVVGGAQLPDGTFHAFLWRDGKMHDLPPVSGAPNAFANGVNEQDDVVGNARDTNFKELDAVLWRNGHAYDLNTLIAPSALHLTTAEYINAHGEIVGAGVLPNGAQRVFLLIRNPSVPLPAPTATVARARHSQRSPGRNLTAAQANTLMRDLGPAARIGRRPAL